MSILQLCYEFSVSNGLISKVCEFLCRTFYASTNVLVGALVGGITFPECSCIHACMCEFRTNILSKISWVIFVDGI